MAEKANIHFVIDALKKHFCSNYYGKVELETKIKHIDLFEALLPLLFVFIEISVSQVRIAMLK